MAKQKWAAKDQIANSALQGNNKQLKLGTHLQWKANSHTAVAALDQQPSFRPTTW